MEIKFNPYYQVLRRFLFKNSDEQFNQHCNKLINEIEDLFCVINGRGNAKFINECSKRILGKSINKKYIFIFFEMYGSYIKNLFGKKDTLNREKFAYIEFPMRDLNNKYVWLRLNFHPVVVNDELLITIIAKDVTEKKALLDEFGENNLWSKSIVENIKLGVVIEDVNRKIISVNRKFMEIFKLDSNPDDFVGTNCGDAAEHLKDLFMEPEAFIQANQKIIEAEKDVIDQIVKMKNGQIIERSFFKFTTNAGDTVCYWIYNDVTEYTQLIDLLSEKEAKYRGILENTQLGILESDTAGVITNASTIFCKMVGYEKYQLMGVDLMNGLLFDDPVLDYFTNLMKNYLPNSNLNNAYEFQIKTQNGLKLWVLVSVAPSFNRESEITGYTGFYYDISDRKALEQSLRVANAASKKAEETEKLFLASMTHELKTPINAIVGMGDLLKLTTLDEEQTEYVNILDTSTKYLQKLVSDVLDSSKIESGHIEFKKKPFNLMNLLIQITHSFDHSLAKNNIDLKTKLHFCPNLEVLSDKTILQQILSNLLSNAEKFTQQGSITLTVEQIEETTDKIKLKFRVTDTGIGFDENLKDLIFEKFTQLPSLNQHKSPGSGLGLSIVKQLLAYQGSSVEVKSKIGEGTDFSFDLTFEKNIAPKRIPLKKNRDFDAPFKNINVLVVEDNELNLQYLSKVLSKWSVSFDIATSGESALAKFSEKEYNLVLLDIQLPGINGFETAKRLRAIFGTHVYTIIAMTAVVTNNIEQEILEVGMNDIVKKPFSMDELYDKIASFFLTDKKKPSTTEVPFYNSSGIDIFKKFYGNDHEFALSVFEKFSSHYLLELKEIIANADKLPQNEINFRLHSIKPSFKMVGLIDIEEEIEVYITVGPKGSDKLTQIFTEEKIANVEMVLDMQIDILKKIVENLY